MKRGISPSVLNVFVDAACNHHGHQGVVPGADEHQGQAQTHPQEGQGPGGAGGGSMTLELQHTYTTKSFWVLKQEDEEGWTIPLENIRTSKRSNAWTHSLF